MADLKKTDRIKLHLGAHRTGTTSLQAALHTQRQNLQSQGIGYWGPNEMRDRQFPGVFQKWGVKTLTKKQRKTIDSIVETSVAIVQQRLEEQSKKGCRQTILSEENVLGAMKTNFTSAGLYPDAPLRLMVISRVFGPYISRVSLTIRSYDEYWRSLISFWLNFGGNIPTPRKLQAFAAQPLNWQNVISDIQTAFPNADIRVMAFEDWISHPEAHIDAIFGARLSLPHRPISKRNASRSMAELSMVQQEQGQLEAAAKLGSTNAPYMPFSPDQIEVMREKYTHDVAEIRQSRLSGVRLLMPGEVD